jgi:heptosyltransferase-2
MSQMNRMLVAAPERWDEACFAVPAVRALVASGLQVGVVCGASQVDFWRTLVGIEVVDFSKNPDLSTWDAAMAWEFGAIAKAIRKAGVVRRIAPTMDRKLMKWATSPLELQVHVLEHRVRYYLATLEALGVATREAAFFAAADAGAAREERQVFICPDSDFGPSHEWPLERWLELVRWLREDCGMQVTLGECAGGRGLATQLATALGDGAEVLRYTSLPESMPDLRKHRVVLSADGSLPHLAAHLGATCVVLFGPNDPAWRRPLGKHHVVVGHHVECAPCLMAKCPLDHRCMERLEVAKVMDAIRPLLSGDQK